MRDILCSPEKPAGSRTRKKASTPKKPGTRKSRKAKKASELEAGKTPYSMQSQDGLDTTEVQIPSQDNGETPSNTLQDSLETPVPKTSSQDVSSGNSTVQQGVRAQ